MLIKNNKGLSIRLGYDISNIYLFEQKKIDILHKISNLLENKVNKNNNLTEALKENSKIILEMYKLGKKIDFGQEFISFFDDNKRIYNNILLNLYNISLDIKDGNFYVTIENDKNEEFIEMLILYLQNNYISNIESELLSDQTFLVGSYINSKYKIIDEMGKGIIRFEIDLNEDVKDLKKKIKIFINFIKRISESNLEIRLYYNNINNDNYNKILNFLEINEEYNNILHYIYIDNLRIYENVSEELFGDFIKYIYKINIDNNFFIRQQEYEENINKIKNNHDFIGIEGFLNSNIIDLGIESLLFNVYSLINDNWSNIFKINLEKFLFNENTDKKIIKFIDENIRFFYEQIGQERIFNIKEITLFNLLYIYQTYFNANNINKYSIELENNTELYKQVSYLLNNNPFSLYYKNYKVDLINEILIEKYKGNIEIDYPLIENFNNFIGVYNIEKELRINENNFLPIKNVKQKIENTEESLISSLL